MTIADRSLSVPPGKIIKTQYVSIWDCKMACRERMAVGDINGAYQKLLQLGDHSSWPCINGYWDTLCTFIIQDGRHEYIASLMMGKEYILVAWIEDASTDL